MHIVAGLTQVSGRPQQATYAVYLLLADLAFTIAVYIVQLMFYVYEAREHALVGSLLFDLLPSVLAYLLSFFILWKIAHGKNWARWWLLVSLALASITTVCSMNLLLTGDPVSGAATLIHLLVAVVAVGLLFQRPSSLWFKSRSVSGRSAVE